MKITLNTQYEKQLLFRIRHAYFDNDEVAVALSATKETDTWLRRNKAVFRRDAPGNWSVCVPSGQLLHREEALRFEIRPQTKDFPYYSILDEEVYDGWRIAPGDSPGVWKVIEIPAGDFAVREVEIAIQTVEKYLEFLLIPKYNPPGIRLRLAEQRGELRFGEPEKVRLWNHEEVQRIVSVWPLQMRYPRPAQVRLWEIRPGGERLLSEAVPLPACNSPSPFHPNNTITTYFYY